jgi:serine/threonine-protein kinase
MAEVRRGHDLRLGRQVAVKRLKPELAADPAFQERFRREAHAVAILNHPGIAAVFDSGDETDPQSGVAVPYIVMEMVDGTTLRSVLQECGSMPVRRAMEITNVVLQALGHSHASGIVHRDIKPANIMVTVNGGIKVMDFGIARATETTSGLTATSMVVGTAQYLSPEQAQGAQVDLRSDLYSTGCLLYELLTGRPPFLGDSAVSLAYQHVREVPEPPSRLIPELGPDIDAVVGKALAKDPAERYQSAAEMAADIDRILQGQATLAATPGESAMDTRETPSVPGPQPAAEVESGATRSLPAAMVAAGASVGASSVGATAVAGPSVTAPPVADPPVDPPAGDAPPTALVDPLDAASEPRRSKGRAVVIAALTLLVLGGVLFGGYWLLGPGGSQRVSVPSIQGSTRAEAEAKLREAGLQAAFVHRRGPNDETRNTVVAQSPGPGAEVEPSSIVTAEINVGPATTKIPGGLVGRNVDKVMEKLADAGFTHVTARPIDSAPKGADPDEVVTVDPAEGERAALEEDVVVRYVAKAAGRATRGPTAGRAPATKDSPTTGKTGDEESGASSPAKIPTRSGSPGDETSTSGPTATETSAPNETGSASSSPAASGDPSDQQSGNGNPGGGEGGILVPSDIPVGDEIPPGGAGVPAAHERIDH